MESSLCSQSLAQWLAYIVVVVQLLSHVQLFATPWTAAHQAPLSFTISWSLLRFMSIESVMPSNHLILCHPLLLLPSIFPSIRVFSNKSALCIILLDLLKNLLNKCVWGECGESEVHQGIVTRNPVRHWWGPEENQGTMDGEDLRGQRTWEDRPQDLRSLWRSIVGDGKC